MTRYIDADAFRSEMYVEAFKKDSDMQRWDSGCWIRYKLFENVLDAQPTAEPVRHGKWMFTPSDAFEAMFAKPKCSECGFESADGGNYCPNCGARMDEERKEE